MGTSYGGIGCTHRFYFCHPGGIMAGAWYWARDPAGDGSMRVYTFRSWVQTRP